MNNLRIDEQRFLQGCDVCGRPTIIPPELMNGWVGCQHCGGTFFAKQESPSISEPLSGFATLPRFMEPLKTATFVFYRVAASLLAGFSEWLSDLV